MKNYRLPALAVMMLVSAWALAQAPGARQGNDALGELGRNTVPDPAAYGIGGFRWRMSPTEVEAVAPRIITLPLRGMELDSEASASGIARRPGESDLSLRSRVLEETTGRKPSPRQLRLGVLTGLGNTVNGVTAYFFPGYRGRLPAGADDESLAKGPMAFVTGVGLLGSRSNLDSFNEFYFIDDRLVGVGTVHSPADRVPASFENTLGQMELDFGRAAPPVTLDYRGSRSRQFAAGEKFQVVCWNLKGRLAVLARQSSGGSFRDDDFTVYYLDIDWYYGLLKDFLAQTGNRR